MLDGSREETLAVLLQCPGHLARCTVQLAARPVGKCGGGDSQPAVRNVKSKYGVGGSTAAQKVAAWSRLLDPSTYQGLLRKGGDQLSLRGKNSIQTKKRNTPEREAKNHKDFNAKRLRGWLVMGRQTLPRFQACPSPSLPGWWFLPRLLAPGESPVTEYWCNWLGRLS